MSRALRFIVLLAGLALLTWGGLGLVTSTTRAWFDKDVVLHSQLVLNGARRAIIGHWRNSEWRDLRALLVDVTRDERIMCADACSSDFKLIAATPDYPAQLKCPELSDLASSPNSDPSVSVRATIDPLCWN